MADAKTDWDAIERDYRAGILTLREIASSHDLTHGAVNKRAKRDGWSRDLNAKIHAKAEELVSKAAVSTQVSKTDLVTEREVVNANALTIADVKMRHRTDIRDGLTLTRELMARLRNPDEEDMNLSACTTANKALAETLTKLISAEREAYGIDKALPDTPADAMPDLGDIVRRIAFLLSRATHQE